MGFTFYYKIEKSGSVGPSPHTWGLRPPGAASWSCTAVHPHIRGVYARFSEPVCFAVGPSPHTWGLLNGMAHKRFQRRSIPTYVGFTLIAALAGQVTAVHPHIRGVYTEIKSKISRASSKTALLPAEKFKILFLVKIKSSAAAFQVHTIFRDQFPPGLHFEIALHL